MTADPTPEPAPQARPRSRRIFHICVSAPAALVSMYLMSAYVVLPIAWRTYSRVHPAISDAPRVTRTANGIAGDPLNIALVGDQEAITRAMVAAGWCPADPITLKSTLRLVNATLLRSPYVEAPVSNLYLWDRMQDLAYQHPVGNNPSQRHHVRFWCSKELDAAGRPVWLGAATYDTRVGLSHTTLQVTHHIGADVDTERDKLLSDLDNAGHVDEIVWIDEFHEQKKGKNGGGDPYHTDGWLPMAVIVSPARSPGDE